MLNTVYAVKNTRQVFDQSENSAITYTVDWGGLLDTDTISTSTWTAETSGITIASAANTTTQATARLSATPGSYLITNKIVTAAGSTREQQIVIRVSNNQDFEQGDYQ